MLDNLIGKKVMIKVSLLRDTDYGNDVSMLSAKVRGKLVYSVQRERFELDDPEQGEMFFCFKPSMVFDVIGNTIYLSKKITFV